MHCIFLASVSNIHFAIIGNAVLYFVAGLEAVVVAWVGVELEFGSWNPGSWCWDLAVCNLESA